MKKLFTIIVLLSFSLLAFSQKEQQNTLEKQTLYCQLIMKGNIFNNKCKVEVDYGQETTFWTTARAKKLKDDSGKVLKFNSPIDALNYMGSLGWELLQICTIQGEKTTYFVYILKKEI